MRSFIINTLKICALTAFITTSAIAASMPSPQRTDTFSGFFAGFDMGASVAQTSISHTRSAVASVVLNLNNVNGSMTIG